MGVPALRAMKARWDLSNDGYAEPNRRLLIDLAFRLAALVQPGFAPPRTRHPVSSTTDEDDYGGTLATTIYRLGDATRGLDVTDRVSDAHDGMTPFEAATEIRVYGLPDGCALALTGTFIAPLYGRPNPASLEARLPAATVAAVSGLMREEFGATLDEQDTTG
jgi:hypothetical protein